MEFQNKYGRDGLTSIGIAKDDEGWQIVKPYLTHHPITYRIVVGNRALARQFKITGLPVTLLIDRQGRLAEAHVGMVDKHRSEEDIRRLLHE